MPQKQFKIIDDLQVHVFLVVFFVIKDMDNSEEGERLLSQIMILNGPQKMK